MHYCLFVVSRTLETFHPPYRWDEIDRVVGTTGGAILAGFLPEADLAELNRQVDEYLKNPDPASTNGTGSGGYDDFLGHRTVRLHGLLEKAPKSAELIGSPDLIAWAGRHIAPGRTDGTGAVMMNAAEFIQIEPGERKQPAHRDTDSWPEAQLGEHPLAVNAIIALDRFTVENGATYIAPESWRWTRDRRARADEYARAVMDAGDAVLFRGDLIHRGGENTSDDRRRALSISYAAGWLRPVENSFLNLTSETIAALSPRLQGLIGFEAYDGSAVGGGLLGLYENGDPSKALPRPTGPRCELRPAREEDAERVAAIWHQGWRDGHLGHVPDELLAARTPELFRQRAGERLADTTVASVDGGVVGFVMVVGDEVEQVYLDRRQQGTGIAQVLLDEAERQVAAGGHQTAWLAVVAGNVRARAFYSKRGWEDGGPFDYSAHGPNGPISVPCHRYEKPVDAG